jgi:predicted DCC family thiol-disulfide oxidoreductase YuxK
MKFLNRMDKYGKVMLTDIEDPSYDSNLPQNQGVTYESGMKVMHAILPDGTVIQGIDCFVKVYDIVGLGWVFSVAKVPVLRPMIDKAYDIWAGYRTLVTRGQNLDQIFIDKREQEINSKLDSITEEDCERCNDVSLPKRE